MSMYRQFFDELTLFDAHDGETPAVGPKMYVSKNIMKKYKQIPCCPGCINSLLPCSTWGRAVTHSNECRQRMKDLMAQDAEGQARLLREGERQKAVMPKKVVGDGMPCKKAKVVLKNGSEIISHIQSWKGSGRRPHSFFFERCYCTCIDFHETRFGRNRDNVLAVREGTDKRQAEGTLECRLMNKGHNVIQTNEAKFKSAANARHAITVLQFLQAAGMMKDELERVKTMLLSLRVAARSSC